MKAPYLEPRSITVQMTLPEAYTLLEFIGHYLEDVEDKSDATRLHWVGERISRHWLTAVKARAASEEH